MTMKGWKVISRRETPNSIEVHVNSGPGVFSYVLIRYEIQEVRVTKGKEEYRMREERGQPLYFHENGYVATCGLAAAHLLNFMTNMCVENDQKNGMGPLIVKARK